MTGAGLPHDRQGIHLCTPIRSPGPRRSPCWRSAVLCPPGPVPGHRLLAARRGDSRHHRPHRRRAQRTGADPVRPQPRRMPAASGSMARRVDIRTPADAIRNRHRPAAGGPALPGPVPRGIDPGQHHRHHTRPPAEPARPARPGQTPGRGRILDQPVGDQGPFRRGEGAHAFRRQPAAGGHRQMARHPPEGSSSSTVRPWASTSVPDTTSMPSSATSPARAWRSS